MRPDQAHTVLQFLLPQFESEHAVTLRIFSAVPRHAEQYRPHPQSRSALDLVRHIAFTEIWFLDGVLCQRFPEGEPPAASITTCDEAAQWYARNFDERLPRLRALTGEHLATPVDWLGLRNEPAVTYLNFAIRHSVHHRGQLSAYLRPMGATVPAIYVESGDEPYPPAEGTVSNGPPPAF